MSKSMSFESSFALDKALSIFSVMGSGGAEDRGYVSGARRISLQSMLYAKPLELTCVHLPLRGLDSFGKGPVAM